MRNLITALSFVLLLLSQSADAALLWGTSAVSELTGSRDFNDGITATGAWEDSFTISWEITELNGTWQYKYCVDGDKDLSHLLLEVTEGCGVPIFSGNQFLEPELFSPGHPSNPGLPVGIWGVKFEGEGCFIFYSDRAPVYGDFYAKSGTGTYAFNDGLLNPDSCNILDFIVRPDGNERTIPTPEPASAALFVLGAMALVVRRRNR